MKDRALRKAIEIAGGVSALSRKLGVTRQAVSLWNKVPINRARKIESITGIPRAQLRPDIFGDSA